jgi:hypothetical protein
MFHMPLRVFLLKRILPLIGFKEKKVFAFQAPSLISFKTKSILPGLGGSCL